MAIEEDPAVADITEKELLLEIFRQTRAIKRILIVVFIVIPILWLIGALMITSSSVEYIEGRQPPTLRGSA